LSTLPKPSIFHFENAWLKNTTFLPAVLPAWSTIRAPSGTAAHLIAGLRPIRFAAKAWRKHQKASPTLHHNLKFLIHQFDVFKETWLLPAGKSSVRSLCRECLALLVRERVAYWKQRGKFRAIKEGDANMAFHHAHTTQHFWRNQIKTIEVHGISITAQAHKMAALTAHFTNILGVKGTCQWGLCSGVFLLGARSGGYNARRDRLVELRPKS
jgi:hypothetical protein